MSIFSVFFIGNHSNLGGINIMGWKLNAMKIGTLTPQGAEGWGLKSGTFDNIPKSSSADLEPETL